MFCRSPLQFLHSSFPWYEAEVVGHLCLKQDENYLKHANCEAPKRERVNHQHHSSVDSLNCALPAHVAVQLRYLVKNFASCAKDSSDSYDHVCGNLSYNRYAGPSCTDPDSLVNGTVQNCDQNIWGCCSL